MVWPLIVVVGVCTGGWGDRTMVAGGSGSGGGWSLLDGGGG